MTIHTHPYRTLTPLPLKSIQVQDGFWGARLSINRRISIRHQWGELEETGRLDNFRIAAGTKKGLRRGFFYNDSDVHKWAEAAALASEWHPGAKRLLNRYIGLVDLAMTDNGYLFTYNQVHFPGQRWVNLQIEHELYTLGHLIEAGVSHYEATGREELLAIAEKCARLLVRDFDNAPPLMTPGHEEIEIALIRLFRATGAGAYLSLAEQFLEKRGRIRFFGIRLARQFVSHNRRALAVRTSLSPDKKGDTKKADFDFTENMPSRRPRFLTLRSQISFLSGRYFQQHRPIRKLAAPAGHSVRWGYLATAMSLLYQEKGDPRILRACSKSWDRMVRRHLYVTGGVGALPMVEGFGRDYELDNESAYCETCAAIASIFWSWEMLLSTGEARYADLMEWQLYNAALPGIGLDGRSYLYRNPLESRGDLARKPWFETACCPGNLSRLWERLGGYAVTLQGRDLRIHHYVSCRARIGGDGSSMPAMTLDMKSGLPWQGEAVMSMKLSRQGRFTIRFRVPSWSGKPIIKINGKTEQFPAHETPAVETASGYSPYGSYYASITRQWGRSSKIELFFPMAISIQGAHPRVKANRGRAAVTRGPLVYCIEGIDNPGVPVPGALLDSREGLSAIYRPKLLGGVSIIKGRDTEGRPLTFIPYFAWANRGRSSMQVWVQAGDAAPIPPKKEGPRD